MEQILHGKILEDEIPVYVVTFATQEILLFRNAKTGEVVVGAEDDDSGEVKGADTDVSKEEDIVVDGETVSDAGVDGDGIPTGAADTGDSPVAGLAPSEACPEIADSSF